MPQRDSLHHVAIQVDEIEAAVTWYRKHFRCEVAYQDESWALLKFANISLALVLPEQHPPHLGIVSDAAIGRSDLIQHRDGTRSTYERDPSGNVVELMEPNSVATDVSVSSMEMQ